ncbi:MDR family MFS transporter [Antarcticimicrobium luteum]|uniref:MFS transporter n=1 Tax=Antarcticimicrobium luteum TaxID=2547397 RepID=A0A4R5V7I2_9RHOB|nr:MDR family MFS transporter [Antarcticimicrobium luteum]TDK48033.1 MFS transporter [Antarcticimicrobium luteum]
MRVRLAILAAATVLFLASLGQTSVSTALPIIVGQLGGLDHITWVITAYLLAATVGAPVMGKMGDLFGRRVVLQAGIGVFLAGAVVSALAPSMWALVAGRFIQGLGGGGLIVVAMASVADVLSPRERGRVQGALGAVFGVSTVVGPLAGGFIVQHLTWQWIFWINLPIGLAAFAVLSLALEARPPQARPSIDYLGAVLLTATLSSAVLIFSAGGVSLAWTSPGMAVLGAVLALSLTGFILTERVAKEPILPLELFRINNFVVSNLVGLIVGGAMFGTITFVPMFMQVVKGVAPSPSGMFLTPMMLGLVGASALAGRVMARTGRYRMLPVWSTLLLAVGMAGMATIGAATPNGLIVLYVFIAGIGIGPVMSVSVTAIQNAVPRETVGVGTASANMFRLIGGSIGTAVFGAMFSTGLTARLSSLGIEGVGQGGRLTGAALAALGPAERAEVVAAIAGALHPVFWSSALLGVLASAAALLMRERPLEDALVSHHSAPKPAEPVRTAAE